ncbi:D-2-hydroxyacid dehydrogenase [Hymenobacter sp. ASUV-10]|uniref:D-2-hydroxyacid dehydrogenase n=1 Tax=Hymenobacter aranciens TaxID=3063996 RepID=A0ABT9BBX9_9BACT|nr:D-2-hydroxyacid dehydrogenase [Hymenobacter sp. ASUV-10]MDO7874211.1 D-2-hydroxyacid dehydrogenase [Hymenobacter sp. ASUV-10]
MQLFIYTDYDAPARDLLCQQLTSNITPVFRRDLPTNQQQAAFQQADFLLGNPPAEWLTPTQPQLQFWQIDSAGFERYADLRLPCPVANMGDYFAWACAETIVAGLIAHYRHLPELARLQAEQRWVGAPIRKQLLLLRDQRTIILGAGAIALAVRQQLSGFGCPVQLLARTNPAAQLHSKEELKATLPETDLVINCLPGSADNFFSAELIQAMRPGSVYANVGRGNTTDEPALLAALQSGHLAGAVLDVTATEPLPPDHPFWQMPNVLLTQHTAGGQPREDEGKVEQFLRNLHRLQNGQELENLVDISRGY